MVTCPRCGRPVDRLHPVPAEVITTTLVASVGPDDAPADLEVCTTCVIHLMDHG